jgi:hypothetical protein
MRCDLCGCTDGRACEGGCFWVFDSLCSACVLQALRLASIELGPDDRRSVAVQLAALANEVAASAAFDDAYAPAGVGSIDVEPEEQLPRLWRPGDPIE